jgi:4-hydroxybenzoate polyprenyltransferase
MATLSIDVKQSLLVRPRQLWLCVVEARPVVLFIYAMRFFAAFALAYVDTGLAVSPWRFALALLTWLLAAASVYLFDGAMDVVEDRLNGSTRPIARGDLPRAFALNVNFLWAGLSLAGAVLLGSPYVFLVPVILVLGYAYSAPILRLKRWSAAAGATVLVAGLLTFVAGGAVSGSTSTSMTLMVFALAMSSWMGFVGALAKDFSDVPGDTLTGRRTCAVVKGIRRAAWRLSLNAFLVGTGFLVAALAVDRLLVWPAVVVLAGALAIALGCRPQPAQARPRGPYRAFMVTQYLAHVAVLGAILWP